MAITNIQRDWGVGPSIVRVTSTDNEAAITAVGYVTAQLSNIEALNNGPFEWVPGDFVAIYYADGQAFFVYDPVNHTFAPVAEPGELPAHLTNQHIFVGNAGNVATDVAMTGDVGISNLGVTTIANGAVNNAKVAANAAIDYSKLAALPAAEILVGSAGNVATAVAMGGDVAIDNAGNTTIQNDAVTTVKLLDANVTLAKLAPGITPSHVIKYGAQYTTVGGAAAEAIAIAGVLATDLAFVQLVAPGGNMVTVSIAVCTANTLTVTFSADPGNDAMINYQIIRAAA